MAARPDMLGLLFQRVGALVALPVIVAAGVVVLVLAAGAAVLAAGALVILGAVLFVKFIVDMLVQLVMSSGAWGGTALVCIGIVLLTSWFGPWIDGTLP